MIGREKGKVPYVDEDEYDIYCWLYVFDEMFDMDEGYCCENCGCPLSWYAFYNGLCEC